MPRLYEVLRPRRFDDVVGQDDLVRRLRAMADQRQFGGQSLWFAGASGTGKTTLARIVAGHVTGGCEFAEVEVDSTGLNPKEIDAFERQSRGRPLGAGGWCFIVNESHGLRKDTVRQLLVTLERVPDHVAWCFTTTLAGQEALFEGCEDSHPLLSRCIYLPLEHRVERLERPQMQYLAQVALSQGIPVDPAKLVAAIRRCRCNMREQLQLLTSGGLS